MTARCSTPDTICLLCGDRGWSNAFVYCVKCLNVAVHRYCLDFVPSTVDEFVHWVCDFCDHSTSAPSSSTIPSTTVATASLQPAPTPTPLDSAGKAAAPARDDGGSQDSPKFRNRSFSPKFRNRRAARRLSSPSAAAESNMEPLKSKSKEGKKKPLKSKSKEDLVTAQCRSNLNRLAHIYAGVKYTCAEKKIEICKKTIFFKLLGKLYNKKNNLGYFEQLTTLYDAEKEAFIIKDRHLKLCAKEISYLTGLPCQGQLICEKKASSLPTYFVNLCERNNIVEVPSQGPISVKLICGLLKKMEIETEEDEKDFKRLLNTMVFMVFYVKSQGKVPRSSLLFCESFERFDAINWPKVICDRIHHYFKTKKDGKHKKNITCLVQVVEAWFNMRTGLFQREGAQEDGVELAPLLSYLGQSLSKTDAHNFFEQIKPKNISNCRDMECKLQEKNLDEDVGGFSYRPLNHLLFTLVDDYTGELMKHMLTKSMAKHAINGDVEEVFLRIKTKYGAEDNLHLFDALICKRGKLPLVEQDFDDRDQTSGGDNEEHSESSSSRDDSKSRQSMENVHTDAESTAHLENENLSQPSSPKELSVTAADNVAHASDTVSHTADTVSHAADTVSHAADTADTVSHAADTVSHAADTVSHAADSGADTDLQAHLEEKQKLKHKRLITEALKNAGAVLESGQKRTRTTVFEVINAKSKKK